MNVLYIHSDKELNIEYFFELISYISNKKRQRINRYRLRKDAQNSLLGDILLHYALRQYFIHNEDVSFGTNEYGKPFLKSHPNIQYNISHTDNYVACAITKDIPVGVDVETVKPIELDLAERFFTKNEYKYIANCPLEQQMQCFYRIWTRKESYVKMIGKGLTIPLNSFNVLKNKDIHYEEFLFTDEVIGTVCTREQVNIDCEEVHLEQLLTWFFGDTKK